MNNLKPGDYGYRRKRYIEAPDWAETMKEKREEIVSGVNWGDTDQGEDLEEGEEEVEVFDNIKVKEDTPIQDIKIDNKPIDAKKFEPKIKEEELQKITIYLDKNLINTLKILKKGKSIESYSQCIRSALIEYLTR